jgi:hypothetical protein
LPTGRRRDRGGAEDVGRKQLPAFERLESKLAIREKPSLAPISSPCLTAIVLFAGHLDSSVG